MMGDTGVLLIIDDDHALVATLKEGLESQGFRVAAAYDGLQGVFQAHQQKPSAIILDFNMPAGGGVSVYQRLRASTDTVTVPIIFLTGVTVQEVREKIRTTPYTYFLRKPASLSQLCTVLEKILGQSPSAPQPKGAAVEPSLQEPPRIVPSERPAFTPPPDGEKRAVQRPSKIAAPTGSTAGKVQEFEFRVTYADTDKLGLIYYANYFKYFEQGRAEFFRALGISLRDLEDKKKLYLPVVEARCEYLAPCRYDDLLVVRTWLAWMGPASLCFQNEICDKGNPGLLIARGFSRHAVLDSAWKPVRLPADLKTLLAPRVVL